MVRLVIFLILAVPVVLGYGVLARTLTLGRAYCDWHAGELAFAGLAVLTTIAVILNFFMPLSTVTATGLAVFGLGGLAIGRLQIWNQLFDQWRQFVPLAVIVPVTALGVLPGIVEGDNGLYHLPMIKWHLESTLPLGLANLHGRFGFNSEWFALAAAFNWPGITNVATNGINALLTVLVFWSLTLTVQRDAKIEAFAPARIYAILGLLLLCAGAGRLAFKYAWAPGTDLPGNLLTIYAFLIGLQLVPSSTDHEHALSRFSLLGLLVAFSIAIKLSQLPLLLLVILGSYWWKSAVVGAWTTWGRAIGLPVFIGVLWILRGIWISGCAVYPQSWSCVVALPWSVDPALATDEMRAITAWARQPSPESVESVLTGWQWVGSWFLRLVRDANIRIALLGVLLAGAVSVVLRRRFPESGERAGYGRTLAAVAAVAAGCLIFWFLAAPAPRFGYGIVISVSLLVSLFLLGRTIPTIALNQHTAIILTLALFLMVIQAGFAVRRIPVSDWLTYSWPRVPEPPMLVHRNHQGKEIHSAPSGSPHWGECYRLPRPCTPYVDTRLTMTSVGRWPMFIGGHKKHLAVNHE